MSPTESSPDHNVSARQWRVAVLLTLAIVFGGAGLAILLALGLADPPRAGSLRWQASELSGWLSQTAGDLILYTAPLSITQMPVTLEISAENQGSSTSAWGIWLQGEGRRWFTLVSNEGYLSVSGTARPAWAEFLHIRRGELNTLYLHVEADGTATLRINAEIAWSGRLTLSDEGVWGIAASLQAVLDVLQAAVYG